MQEAQKIKDTMVLILKYYPKLLLQPQLPSLYIQCMRPVSVALEFVAAIWWSNLLTFPIFMFPPPPTPPSSQMYSIFCVRTSSTPIHRVQNCTFLVTNTTTKLSAGNQNFKYNCQQATDIVMANYDGQGKWSRRKFWDIYQQAPA